jgi:serine/threonine protein kinase
MVYAHLARDPPKLATLEPEYISTCLSEIIKKMMAKPPCERYQSAEGIKKDLEHCKSCFITTEHNPEHIGFVPGRYDVSRIFKIPPKLYGRDKEHQMLLDCVEYAKVHELVAFVHFRNSYKIRKILQFLFVVTRELGKRHW